MQDAKVQCQEDKAFVQNGYTEKPSDEDDGCEDVQLNEDGEVIIDDDWEM